MKKAPMRAPFSFRLPVSLFEKRVAGRERCHEEATRIAPRPAEPHGLRRCGGPEQPAGLFRERRLFSKTETNASVDFQRPPLSERHATSSSRESNLQKPHKRWICRQSNINLNGYGLRARDARECKRIQGKIAEKITPRRRPRGCGRRAWRGRAPGRRA